MAAHNGVVLNKLFIRQLSLMVIWNRHLLSCIGRHVFKWRFHGVNIEGLKVPKINCFEKRCYTSVFKYLQARETQIK